MNKEELAHFLDRAYKYGFVAFHVNFIGEDTAKEFAERLGWTAEKFFSKTLQSTYILVYKERDKLPEQILKEMEEGTVIFPVTLKCGNCGTEGDDKSLRNKNKELYCPWCDTGKYIVRIREETE